MASEIDNGWIYPQADRVSAEKGRGGNARHPNSPPRVVLHTTEMVSRSREAQENTYRNHPHPPHLWVSVSQLNSANYIQSGSSRRRNGTGSSGGHDTYLQRIPLHKTAYALRNTSAPGETNHEGKYCIQVEIEGYAGDAASWDEAILTKLASEVLVPIGKWIRANGYPDWLYTPYREVGCVSGAYGKRGVARISQNEWRTLTKADGTTFNLLTHQEVPENTHWDCGGLRLGDLARTANMLLESQSPTPTATALLGEAYGHMKELKQTLDALKENLIGK